MTPKTDALTLIKAMRHLANDIQSDDGVANAAIAEAADRLAELERENAALKQRILDDNKAYGCELMDPSGTIWDHAKRLQQENAALREAIEVEKERGSYWNDFAENATVLNAQLRADRDRLDWLLDNISPDSVLWNVNPTEDSMSEGAPDPWRAAIDTARKKAKT